MKQLLEFSLPKPDTTERNIFFCKGVDDVSVEAVAKDIVKINEEDDRYQKIYDFYGFSIHTASYQDLHRFLWRICVSVLRANFYDRT